MPPNTLLMVHHKLASLQLEKQSVKHVLLAGFEDLLSGITHTCGMNESHHLQLRMTAHAMWHE
jgi:hypothetical protein